MLEPYAVLPDDVIQDIFARLPAKVVYRCRCLSRTWASRLGSDDFANRHFCLANDHGGPRILFLQACVSGDRCMKVHTWSPDNPDGTNLTDVFARQCDTNHSVPRLVTQQCQGLVILKAYGDAHRYYVLNPSTGRMMVLPQSPAMARGEITRLGLGYDARTKKHKVICIYYCGIGEKTPGFNGCEVYVINSSKREWRMVEGCGEKQRGPVIDNQESVFVQGRVHWLAKHDVGPLSEETFVFSFSLDNETSGSMPLPQFEMGRKCYNQRLTELQGRLCLFCTEIHNTAATWARSIWLLRAHDTCVWDLHCRIDFDTLPPKVASFMRSGYSMRLLGIDDSGHRIILVRPQFTSSPEPSFMLCSYDPVTKDMENLIDDSGLVSNSKMLLRHAVLFEESIASPG